MSADGPWERHARHWSQVGPPLRPAAEDVEIARAAIDGWRARVGDADPTVLLLGVTPELWQIDLGERGRAIATDHSLDMIRAVWPGPIRPQDAALGADWRRLPLADASIDVALADGALTNLPFPAGYAEVAAELRRALADDGRWVARCFVQAARPEPVTTVLRDLATGRAGGFHAFKWRLAMALQPDAATGVALADVWSALAAVEPDLAALAARYGWTPESVRTIEAYRGLEARYTFPALEELADVFRRAGFAMIEAFTPAYELGDRCPTLVMTSARGHVTS